MRRKVFIGMIVRIMVFKIIVIKNDIQGDFQRGERKLRTCFEVVFFNPFFYQTPYDNQYEKNQTKIGDKVKIMETRPLSKDKRWRLLEVVEAHRE